MKRYTLGILIGFVIAGADIRHVQLTPEVDFFAELEKAIRTGYFMGVSLRGGLRKIRVPIGGSGKRGGARVIAGYIPDEANHHPDRQGNGEAQVGKDERGRPVDHIDAAEEYKEGDDDGNRRNDLGNEDKYLKELAPPEGKTGKGVSCQRAYSNGNGCRAQRHDHAVKEVL